MQLYDRGIRRRLAPMLEGDRRRMELAYSLMFTLPGTPVVRYGDELGRPKSPKGRAPILGLEQICGSLVPLTNKNASEARTEAT
jgi:glycosidase